MQDAPEKAIGYGVYQIEMERKNRVIMALIVVIAVIVLAAMMGLYLQNRAFLDYLSQYDFESYEVEQDGEGLNIFGNGSGNGVRFYGPDGTGAP